MEIIEITCIIWQCYGNQSIKLLICAFSCACSQKVWKALKKLELLSAAPQATPDLALLLCSPNFP